MGRRYKCNQKRETGTLILQTDETGVEEQEEATDESAEENMEEKEGPAIPFLLRGFPQGFLTGCILYMTHYSLMIGHWKIAVGMAGMWILLMLNYEGMILQRQGHYPIWQVIGLCLVEGWIIEVAGWFFRSQKVRLYYFIVLGIITVIIQVVNLLHISRERKKRGL